MSAALLWAGAALMGLVAVAGIGAVGLSLLLIWIARGESDVNGDPERDAGIE